MKRILLFICLFTATAALAQDGESFQSQYARIYKAYVHDPDNVICMLDMANFYSAEGNPMRNLVLAYKYAQQAETRFIAMVEDRSQYKEVSRLIRKKVSVNLVRQTKQHIVNETYAYVSDTVEIGTVELDNIANTFKNSPSVMHQVEARRLRLALAEAHKEHTLASYDAFVRRYNGTEEAIAIGREMTQLATQQLQSAETAAAVDSLVRDYAGYDGIQRAATRRKATLAFATASKTHTEEAYRDFLSQYPSANEYGDALDRLETLLSTHFATLHTPEELAQFALHNSDSPLSEQAMEKLRSMIRDDHDLKAAEIYFKTFPLDAEYNNLYRKFFERYAEEGNVDPIDRFRTENPNFPYMAAADEEYRLALRKDSINLMRPFDEAQFLNAASDVRFLTGKKVAYVALLRTMQQLIAAHNWKACNERMDYFLLSFDETSKEEYEGLRTLINAPANKQRTPTAQLRAASGVENAAVHPNGRYMYYTQVSKQGTSICMAQRNGNQWKPVGEVKFSNAENKGLRFFNFFDNGHRMLLGSGGDIWIAEFCDTAWRVAEIPSYPINTDYYDYDAYMVPDGSGMLLASDRPYGHNLQHSRAYFHGDTALASDIYFVPRKQQGWGTPVNLGLNVNSPYCDHSPILSRDLKTLYFISDGRTNLGYGDLFMTTRNNVDDWTSWATPQNYGKETNSGFDELSATFADNERSLIYCSKRNGNSGAYSVASAHDGNSGYISVTVFSPDVEIRADIVDWSSRNVTTTERIRPNKPLKLQLHNEKRFAVVAYPSTEHFTPSVIFSPKSATSVDLQAFDPERLANSNKIALPVVQFETGSVLLSDMAQQELNNVATFANAHADMGKIYLFVNVNGNNDKQCFDLSRERGSAIKRHLEQQGVDPERIIVTNYGNMRYQPGETAPASEVEIQF